MKNRGKLPLLLVREFSEWLAGEGWINAPDRQSGEILRMRHPRARFEIVVYGIGDHTSTDEPTRRYVKWFLKWRRWQKNKEPRI